MAFKPSDITKEHVIEAVKEIETSGIVLKTGTRWEVIINDISYPPKEVMRYARKQYDGSYDWPNGGGWPTNQYLEKMGFDVKEKGVNIINLTGHRIFKFSMGTLYKETRHRNSNIIIRLAERNLISMHEATANQQGALFTKGLEVGDFVYITYGKDKLGAICRIIEALAELPEDIASDVNDNGYKCRKIEVLIEPKIENTRDLVGDKRSWLPSGYSTIKEITNIQEANNVLFRKYYEIEFTNSDQNDKSINVTDSSNNPIYKFPHNQILYGPPGTGKTFATKELAVKIANPYFQVANTLTEIEKRQKITGEYKSLFEAGQIVFTTFHQSMSYEDFVEGIKPETLDNDVVYNVQPGLLKLLCEKASLKSNSNFEEVLEHFKEDVMNNQPYTIETGRSKFDVFYRGGLTFRINPHESTNVNPNYPASIENLLKYYQTDSVESIYNPSYIRGIINHLYDEYGLVKYHDVAESPDKNYVLIIDEINRGNVSAIFGELITLLEADKRVGASEEIRLKLPYSKTDFGVPPNLYIIGTMNTADRSVEALDTALRRRFSFVEVMPNHDILDREVEGFNLKNILETINNRVEALLDRDHTIGHSYFIKVNDKAALIKAFENCIIPLLQEYFYGDYEKINLVLGDGFICKDKKNTVIFAGNNFNSGYVSTERYIFPALTEENIDSAIRKLLNIKEAAQIDESREE